MALLPLLSFQKFGITPFPWTVCRPEAGNRKCHKHSFIRETKKKTLWFHYQWFIFANWSENGPKKIKGITFLP